MALGGPGNDKAPFERGMKSSAQRKDDSMRMKKAVRTIGVTAVAVAGAAGLGAVQPASAAPVTVHAMTVVKASAYGVDGQLDTNPGDGAASWVYGYGRYNAGYIQYQYYDGSIHTLSVPYHGAATVEPGQAVWRIRACNSSWQCGSWT